MPEKDRGEAAAASVEIGKYLEILARDPNSRVFAPLAEAYRKAGLLDDAIQTAIEGLKVHPTYVGGRVALGRAYFEKKQFVEAATEIQKVVKAAPDNLMAHKLLGQIAYEQHDLPTAEKAFRMVLMFDPRDQEAQQLLAAIGSGARVAEPPAPPPPPSPPQPVSPGSAAPSPAAPPPPAAFTAPPAPEPFSLEEIPSLESFDLEEVPLRDLAFETLSPGAAVPPPPPALPPETPPEPLPELDMEDLAPPPRAPEAPAPLLETFTRQPWGAPPPPAPAPAPQPAAPAEESPFEVFGRPKRTPPPVSDKGEREAFTEIELEPTAYEPVGEPAKEVDSPFEVFTREPRIPEGSSARGGREAAGYRDIELETTAYAVPAEAAGEAAPAPSLELTGVSDEVPAGPPPEPELTESWGGKPGEPEAPVVEAPVVEEPATIGSDDDWEIIGGSVPGESAAGEPGTGEAPRDAFPVEEDSVYDLADEVEPEPPEMPRRGVFDTETLAALYASQGFHARAAEIYRRLLAGRPGDGELRAKLAEAEELVRGGAAAAVSPVEAPGEAPVEAPANETPPPAGAAAPEHGENETIRRLRILQERFTQGRPQ